MTTLYRIKTDLAEFVTPGFVEKAHGLYLLRVSATTDQGLAVTQMTKAGKPIVIEAIVGHEVVMPGISSSVRMRARGNRVELACILGVG